jgi:predicted permease
MRDGWISRLRALAARVLGLFASQKRDSEFDQEMQSHLELLADRFVAQGMSQEDAAAAARRQVGNTTLLEEERRELRTLVSVEDLGRDLRHALRSLGRSRAFAAIAIAMLALGIGATTAIFSIVDGVLLRPLPFPNANRLVTLGDQVSGTDFGLQDPGYATGPEVVIYPRDTRSFESLGGYGSMSFGLSGIGQAAQINAARMTPSMFSALGVAPLIGRVFTAQEDQQKEQVAVLSYATWKSRFNGDPHILGTKILLDRKPYIIIGVMPRNFEFPLYPGRLSRSELWVPMSLTPQELSPEANGSYGFNLVGRLKPGMTPAQAQSDAGRVAQQIMRNYPSDEANMRIHPVVYPFQQITVLQARPLLRMLFLAVVVVLLIACANLAGLLLVRAIRRQREIAVRLALGAPALTLLRQMILESLVLSLGGGLVGIGLAALGLDVGKNLLPETLPLINEITLNWPVAGFALLLAVLTGLFCGLAPGFAALRTNVNATMKEVGRSGSASGSHARLRSALVVAEIAIALILLTASGLLLRSFSNMSAVDLGFRPEHVTTGAYALPHEPYSTQASIDSFNNRLLQQLRQLPGVESVGLTNALPGTGYGNIAGFVADGYVDPRGPDRTAASPSQVIGDYFKAMGIPLIRGRYFTEADTAANQLVAIVNREFAQHYWPHNDPIGRRMRFGTLKSGTPWMTVIGEVADAKLNSPDADAAEQFYQPVAQVEKDMGSFASPTDLNGNGGYIVVRSALPPEQMENALRAIVRSVDAQLPLTQVETMEQVVSQSEAPRRFNTIIISSFALAAVLLAVLGIYGIIAFSVASRVQEMAIRMTLGSPRSNIMRLVLTSGLKLAAIGCVLGLAGAAAASSILRSFLFHVSPFDPAVMIGGAAAVFVLAFAASALPAHRAASVDPVLALRAE